MAKAKSSARAQTAASARRTNATRRRNSSSTDSSGLVAAINKSQALIEFALDGTILTANGNFLQAMGYTLEEVQGQHHSMFVSDEVRTSAEYEEFWSTLNRGEFMTGEYHRLGKNGKDVWIQGSYNPILDESGKPCKVVKFASDITCQKMIAAETAGRMDAISKSQAVIEFEMNGTIICANDNFLNAMGYTLEEVRGKHHSIFVDADTRESVEYKQFWEGLNAGQFLSGEYRRVNKDGHDVWIQGSYNPILDQKGKPFKVVKFATDVTQQKMAATENAGQMEAINKSQAVIEFQMDGTIISANDNFLNAMGYTQSEVAGKHHSMFVDDEVRSSSEYKDFWSRLNRGEYQSGEYRRVNKSGKDVWIQGSYNPILDLNGRPVKVVKYATDVTDRVELERSTTEQHEKTRVLIGEVVESADQFAEGAKVIASSSANLSDAAQSQAATVEEMTASVEELTNSIQVISSSAGESRDQSNESTELAKTGGTAVNEAVSAMRLIQKSSEQIDDIIQVISEIASQTNLLALNAAIEAARAGEHGLGFAVVADEVRKLAERSSEAAKEITGLIKESTRRVSEGAELSERVGVSLESIVSAVNKTGNGIAMIAESTETQAASASQVQSAIRAVSDTTESNAASAEEMAASAEELGAQAARLQELVARFNV